MPVCSGQSDELILMRPGIKQKAVLASQSLCTGCGICASVCPKSCIQMREGYLGHLYPGIDHSSCVGCGVCERICPALHPLPLQPIVSAYASWSMDERVYKTATSGGIATELSKAIIRKGGVVYGCAMLPDVEVKHIRVDSLEELEKLKSSKYVQSSLIEAIPALKKDVAEGKPVLFIGTPCQVSAVKALYRIQPESLFLVDLICHGVPSARMLKDFVRKLVPGRVCTNVTFRNGNAYILRLWENDLLVCALPLRSPQYRNYYLDAFMDGYTFRDSCYQCRFAGPDRIGDITLGDFWGLGKYASLEKMPDHPYGCSVVLPITDKGVSLLAETESSIELYQRDKREAIEGNTQLQRPVRMTKRIRFFRQVQRIVFWPEFYRWINLDRILTSRLGK